MTACTQKLQLVIRHKWVKPLHPMHQLLLAISTECMNQLELFPQILTPVLATLVSLQTVADNLCTIITFRLKLHLQLVVTDQVQPMPSSLFLNAVHITAHVETVMSQLLLQPAVPNHVRWFALSFPFVNDHGYCRLLASFAFFSLHAFISFDANCCCCIVVVFQIFHELCLKWYRWSLVPMFWLYWFQRCNEVRCIQPPSFPWVYSCSLPLCNCIRSGFLMSQQSNVLSLFCHFIECTFSCI
jgi:hypothetical protein